MLRRSSLSILSLVLPLFATPALAEKAIIASCTGKGAHFYLSDEEFEMIEQAAVARGGGAAPSRDAILVIGNGLHWDTRSRSAIDKSCGGKGNDQIAIFDGIQPKSGLWQAKLGETKLQGCPPMMAQAFAQSPGALPEEWKAPRRVDFERPFHPDQLEMTRSFEAGMKSKVVWKQDGNDTWQTEVFPELFAQMPPGQGGGSKMSWRLSVKDDDLIEHDTTLVIALPAEVAATLGSGQNCRMTSHNSWIRVGE